MLSFEITKELTEQLKQISDKASETAAKLKTLSSEHQEALHRYARISTIGSSTRIENAILTDVEIDWMDEALQADGMPTAFRKEKKVIENKLSKERERSIEEVAGCRNMLSIIYSQASDLFPLTEASIKGLHRELLQFYPPAKFHLGRYKTVPNNVVEIVLGTKIQRDVFKTSDPGPITEAAMRNLVDWYNNTIHDYPWSIAVATEFVYRFLAIHPFQDGNGRLGRALFTLAILQSNDKNMKTVLPMIFIDRQIEKHKEEYYLVLRQCSQGKFEPNPIKYRLELFLKFTLKMLVKSLEFDIDYYSKKYFATLKLADAPRKILICFKEHPEKKLQVKEIMEITQLPRRTIVHALQTLMRDQFLQKLGSGPSTKYQLTF